MDVKHFQKAIADFKHSGCNYCVIFGLYIIVQLKRNWLPLTSIRYRLIWLNMLIGLVILQR